MPRLPSPLLFCMISCAAEPPKKVDVPPPLPPPTESVATASPSPPPTAPTKLDAAATPPAGPQPVARVQTIACKLTSASWVTSPSLAFAPGKPPYVNIAKGAKVEIHVSEVVAAATATPATTMPDVFVSAQTGGLAVEGMLIEPAALVLHVTRAFQATPYLVPRPKMDATLAGSGKGTLRVDLSVPNALTPTNAKDFSIERPCADFGLDVAHFDAATAWGSPKVIRKLGFGPRDAALLDAPSGTKVAQLTVDKDKPPSILEEKNGHALVLWELDTAVVRGWVKSSELRPLAVGVGYGVGGAGGMPGNKIARSTRQRRCTMDVPLIVRHGQSERWIVGRVIANTLMHLFDKGDKDFSTIEVNQNGLWLKEGYELEVRDADVFPCARE